MSDVADRYLLLSDGFLARIRATADDRWDASSPCEGWTARDVVAHVVNGHRGILALVDGTPPAPADGVGTSSMAEAPAVEPGADLGKAFERCRDAMHAMLVDPERAAFRLPWGPLGPVAVEQAVDIIGGLELLGHTWDLARAVGGDEILAPDLVARTHEALKPHYANLQATGAFQPSIPAPPDADPQTAFLLFVGRKP
ncbi:maleylpyruvate isomerase family mycothiol-dependent enzyme [Actinomadura rupiterrae]|uniref:maleylpyruvate isomerase family mycothiol-dependent enzyme n=1 Tax=Actinomadura rupiterrae TaxID=559627 RepID=UPI0020A43267|nr:maleylpyruvate isomerase family mycothiol-dependent enzyme [Actinomadura rupiterrae]MCP2342580.1 uncharacterized protein (TIGR03086 family) [Actinomadura rupiterrae]